MASPHVAGAVALYLQGHPGASPAVVRDALVANGSSAVLNAGAGTTTKLLFITY